MEVSNLVRQGDYVEKLANAIENKLNMSSEEIQKLSNSEFRDLLRHGFFSAKPYSDRQTEPTRKQLNVLNLHYNRQQKGSFYDRTPSKPGNQFFNLNKQFTYKNHKQNKTVVPKQIRINKAGRYIDAKTGRFVKKNK